MTSWVDVSYVVVALTGMGLAVYVMQKTEHDRINKVDPLQLQWIRRLAFTIVALALCYSIIDEQWHRSLPIVFLVGAGVCNLAVNAIALFLRSPPDSGKPKSAMVDAGHPRWVMPNSGVNAMDQG